jgi:hypothetical protein
MSGKKEGVEVPEMCIELRHYGRRTSTNEMEPTVFLGTRTGERPKPKKKNENVCIR